MVDIAQRRQIADAQALKAKGLPKTFIDSMIVGGVPPTRSSAVDSAVLARVVFSTNVIADGAAGDYRLVPRDSESIGNPFSLDQVGAGGGAVLYAARFEVSLPDGQIQTTQSEKLRRLGELVITTSNTSAPMYIPISPYITPTGPSALATTTAPAVTGSSRAQPADAIRFVGGSSFLFTADKPDNLKVRLLQAISVTDIDVVVTAYFDAILVDRPTAQLLASPMDGCGSGAGDAVLRAALRESPMPSQGVR